jgi:hypothetical protein
VEDVELLAHEFDHLLEEFVGLALGVAAEESGHDEEEALEVGLGDFDF